MTVRNFYFSWPGLGPAAEVLVLCFAKEKYPKERRAEIGVPSLRYGHLALLNFSGGTCKLASLKQAHSLIRKNLRCSATLHGTSGSGQPGQWNASRFCGDEPLPVAGRSPGALGRERSEFSETPAKASSARCPQRSEGTRNPAAFFFGDFLLVKQKKVTAQSGAQPDQTV